MMAPKNHDSMFFLIGNISSSHARYVEHDTRWFLAEEQAWCHTVCQQIMYCGAIIIVNWNTIIVQIMQCKLFLFSIKLQYFIKLL